MPANMLIKFDSSKQYKYMAMCTTYRGNVVPKDVWSAFWTLRYKRTIQFVDWMPSLGKMGVNYQPLPHLPGDILAKRTRDLFLVANSTAVSDVFSRIAKKFDKIYANRRHIHSYLCEGGIEEAEFQENREILESLLNEYELVGTEQPEGEEEGME